MLEFRTSAQQSSGLAVRPSTHSVIDVCYKSADYFLVNNLLQVENVLMSSAGNYVLCDFGSATGVTIPGANIQQVQDDLNR